MKCFSSPSQYTNNTVTDPGSARGVKPALGQTWSYVPHTRLTLTLTLTPHSTMHGGAVDMNSEERPVERIATLRKSSRMVRSLPHPHGGR